MTSVNLKHLWGCCPVNVVRNQPRFTDSSWHSLGYRWNDLNSCFACVFCSRFSHIMTNVNCHLTLFFAHPNLSNNLRCPLSLWRIPISFKQNVFTLSLSNCSVVPNFSLPNLFKYMQRIKNAYGSTWMALSTKSSFRLELPFIPSYYSRQFIPSYSRQSLFSYHHNPNPTMLNF